MIRSTSLDHPHKYDDIINLPHHVSAKHPQMSLLNRAAQFSPFAALTGHAAAIRETARQTEAFMELNEDQKEQLNEQLLQIKEMLSQKPEASVEITCFQPDQKKNGGAYVTMQKKVKKIDEFQRRLLFSDGSVLSMEYLFSVEFPSL